MSKRFFPTLVLILLSSLALPAVGAVYSFPTEMKVTIERGEEPIYTEGSNLVYPVVSYFSYKQAFGDTETTFALFRNGGDTLTATVAGDRFKIAESIARNDEISFAPDLQTAPRPIRVLLTDPIAAGHVHFTSGSARLTTEAKRAVDAIAVEMKNADLLGALLVGLTDQAGSASSNLSLGAKRAKAVKRYLEKRLSSLGATDFMIARESLGEYLSVAKNGQANLKDRKVTVLIYSHS